MIERRIGFIGAGVMAEALAGSMLRAGAIERERLCAADPAEERRAAFAEATGCAVLDSNLELLERSDVVVLSVKPNVVPAVAGEVGERLSPDHLLVSIAAGVRLKALSDLFGTERAVRVMPNTPLRVGAGASAYCLGRGATEEDGALVEAMLAAGGVCVRVEEKHMDAVTGLSGSGPAYVYMVIEALRDGGVKAGLSPEVATRLAAQTVLGAAKMVLETGREPRELRDQVATPGGTTVEGIRVLEGAAVQRAFMDAVAAATEKSRKLGER